MKWKILINQEGNHFKFWAYEENEKVFAFSRECLTGRVRFGRIGTIGREYIETPSYVYDKISEKVSKGYRHADEEFLEEHFPVTMMVLWEV